MVEVLVILGMVGFFLVWALVAIPRGRETSRLAVCQQNLMQIGFGLQLYHQASRQYPTVPVLESGPGDSPIKALIDGLTLSDLRSLRDGSEPPRPTIAARRGTRVPGLTCPSDLNATDRRYPAATSYRSNVGDSPSGQHGPFQPGRVRTSEAVEAADGLSFTAGFAERLVGDGRDRSPDLRNYATTPAPVGDFGCSGLDPSRWKGDAGSDWSEAGWRSTLYGHLLAPNGSPSCLADDGQTAAIGASSAHPSRINVLMLDGSLRGVTPSIDLKVWQAVGTVDDSETPRR